MDKIQFAYFQGMEAEQYSFYRVPKILFTNEYFKTLSCEAKVLYGLMLDRMGLSMKNRWFDEAGRVYIIFTIEEIMELMCCKTQKAIKLMKELDRENGIGLIEKKRLGFGRPNVIYVKNFKIKEKEERKELDEQGDDNEDDGKSEGGQGMDDHIEEGTVQQTEGEITQEKEWEEQEEGAEPLKQNFENQNSRILIFKNQEGLKKNSVGKEKDSLSDNEDLKKQKNVKMEKTGENLNEISQESLQNFDFQNSRVLKIENQEFPKSKFKNGENQNSRVLKIKNQEFPKSKCNNTEFNHTDPSETDLIHPYPINLPSISPPKTVDVMERMEQYREIIRKNISYESFVDNPYYEQQEVDELVELMGDIMMLPDNRVLRIGGIERQVSVVKSRFMQLRYPHMEYVMYCLKKSTSKVENIRAYLLTTLYNATMTIENFYRSEVHHDQCRNG